MNRYDNGRVLNRNGMIIDKEVATEKRNKSETRHYGRNRALTASPFPANGIRSRSESKMDPENSVQACCVFALVLKGIWKTAFAYVALSPFSQI